jgi:hypothetical protein
MLFNAFFVSMNEFGILLIALYIIPGFAYGALVLSFSSRVNILNGIAFFCLCGGLYFFCAKIASGYSFMGHTPEAIVFASSMGMIVFLTLVHLLVVDLKSYLKLVALGASMAVLAAVPMVIGLIYLRRWAIPYELENLLQWTLIYSIFPLWQGSAGLIISLGIKNEVAIDGEVSIYPDTFQQSQNDSGEVNSDE